MKFEGDQVGHAELVLYRDFKKLFIFKLTVLYISDYLKKLFSTST